MSNERTIASPPAAEAGSHVARKIGLPPRSPGPPRPRGPHGGHLPRVARTGLRRGRHLPADFGVPDDPQLRPQGRRRQAPAAPEPLAAPAQAAASRRRGGHPRRAGRHPAWSCPRAAGRTCWTRPGPRCCTGRTGSWRTPPSTTTRRTTPGASPLQHFWSLSIQGQVFVLWPLVFAGAAVLLRFLRRDPVWAVG